MHTIDQIVFTRRNGDAEQIILTMEPGPSLDDGWTVTIGADTQQLSGDCRRAAAGLFPGLFSSHPRVTNLKVDCITVIGPAFDQTPSGDLVTVNQTYKFDFIDAENFMPVTLLEAAGHLPMIVMDALDSP